MIQHHQSLSTAVSLTFNETKFRIIDQGGQIWLRASEIAQALGYANTDAVGKLYDRNADEFDASMTQVIDITETPNSTVSKNLQTKTRIFSLRGCHLLAMFARTAVAKEFRKWVLDVLTREVSRYTRSTKSERSALHEAISLFMSKTRGLSYVDVYAMLHQSFNAEHLDEIPLARLPEAVALVHGWMLKHSSKPQNTAPVIDQELLRRFVVNMHFLRSWWSHYHAGIKGINPHAAASVHEHFISGSVDATTIARHAGIHIPHNYINYYPWAADNHERLRYWQLNGKSTD
ncbi:MAG: BRO family protein [Pseudomonadota bacterium]|nr:BRO family protein [Pseudomonadota bacterium]